MHNRNTSPNRVLLGQLISNGDCLYATAIAQQIKHDFPGCHLTWAVSSLCRKTIEGNPWIDDIWEIPLASWADELLRASWHWFSNEALNRYEQGLYDFVFFSQIYPGSPHHFEGTVRPGIFLGYPGKITVSLRPSLHLRIEEVQKVIHFAQQNRLQDFEQIILFECTSKSGQSHITPEFALQAAEKIVEKSGIRRAVIVSSQHAVQSPMEGIIDGSVLTLREMAELTKYCSLLIGCSSGISCVSTSTWAKPLPMIQMLANRCAMFASLAHDYLYFGLPTSHVIEMFDADVERLVSCIDSLSKFGWVKTRALYHQDPQIAFAYYLDFAKTILLNAYDYYGFCISLQHVVNRYGWHPDLQSALREVASKILGPSAVVREVSPDHLLWKLGDPARALSSASSGIWGHDAPSLRPETCVVCLRRNKSELGKLLGATFGMTHDDPEFLELVAALTDTAPKERIAFLQAKYPKEEFPRFAWILALMQQAEYSEALQELLQWKEKAASWNAQLEEILGDLNWMQGYHSKALASYHDALQKRPNDSLLQNKMDRLVIRNGGSLAPSKPKVEVRDLGLALYSVEPISNSNFVKGLTQSRLQIAELSSLDTAFLATPGNDPKAWSVIGGKALQNTEFAFSFSDSNGSPDCKKFIGAAVDWADQIGKTWIALARLGSIITIPFLRELEERLARQPSALIVDKWDIFVSADGSALNIPQKRQLTPALILMRIDWWKKNSWRFRGYNLLGVNWMALYAIKILRLTKAAYLCGSGERLLTLQAEEPPAGRIKRLKQLGPILKGDLDAMIRSKLFELYSRRTNLNLNGDQTRTEALVHHFTRSSILNLFLLFLPRKDKTSALDETPARK
jgi:hypothetical protein